MIRVADNFISFPYLAVTYRENTFSPDAHYFESIEHYWWLDSSCNGSYARKDGIKKQKVI